VDQLVGDATKAENMLGWTPEYTFNQLVSEMVQSDLETLGRSSRRSLEHARVE
jgi:GDPmannose 4,6-dehydratase